LIAIPDFGPGAMENFGAITFREIRLLVDEKTASTTARQDVAAVVAHEMAHQWFGDLVTMKWWDDLWLNEAFATWMGAKVVDNYRPDWHSWDLFVKDREHALALDSLSSTHPIYAQVSDPAEAEEMFDEITYEKGASVLRMLEKYLGEETYMKGVQQYIREHEYANAETNDLWQALESVSGKPIAKIMHEWIDGSGYPCITVETTDGTRKNQPARLSQSQFSISEIANKKTKEPKPLWQIPATARFLGSDKNDEVVRFLLAEKKQPVSQLPSDRLFLLNAGADGYFRVQYPQAMLHELGKRAQKELSARERYQLLDDTWAMVEAGNLPIAQYLALTGDYNQETDPNVIELLVGQFQTLDWYIKDESRPQFAAFVRDRLSPIARKLGWEPAENEPELTQLLRAQVLTAMGTIGQDPATISEARKEWNIYLSNPESLNPNLYEPLVIIMAYNGDETVYEEMLRLFKEARTPEASVRNLNGLAYFRNPLLQKRTLELVLTDEVKTQDAPHVILTLLMTTAGRQLGWSFVKEHWSEMEARYPRHIFPRIVGGATSLVLQEQADDISRFLSEHPMKAGRRAAGKVVERVRSNVRLNERASQPLSQWLKDFSNRTSASLN